MSTYDHWVYPQDTDAQGAIMVPSLCRSIINSISNFIREEGFGVDVMRKKGLCWVLSRYVFEFDTRPSLYTPFKISVWDGYAGNVSLTRCVRIKDNAGKEIGRGVSEWCVIDSKSRSLIRPADILIGKKGEEPPCRRPDRIGTVKIDTSETRIMRFSDCDFNGHVNNIRYVEMLYDLLPEFQKTSAAPLRLSAHFLKEAHLGESLNLGLGKAEDGYDFVVARPGSTICTLALRSML